MRYPRVLVASKSFGHGARPEALEALFRTYSLTPLFSSLEQSARHLDTFEGMIIGTSKITRELLACTPRLRAVAKYGVGIDNIDVDAARELGIQVLNMPGINAQAVAELTFGLILATARQIPAGDRSIRAGKWVGGIGRSVAGSTLGIIGTGAIGCTLQQMVQGFTMNVLGYDIVQNPAFIAAGGKYVELEMLLSTSDFITVHLTLNAQTLHFIDRQKLSLVKPNAILINTSRGKVVDEQALFEALQSNRLGGAGLDVFESEPPASRALVELDNVVSTPHVGAYTEETLHHMDETCVSILSAALLPQGGGS